MLRIYVSAHCAGCTAALHHAQRMQAHYPDLAVSVVDVDASNADVPSNVIGTPVYLWNNQVLFLGNPSEDELVERVRALHENRH